MWETLKRLPRGRLNIRCGAAYVFNVTKNSTLTLCHRYNITLIACSLTSVWVEIMNTVLWLLMGFSVRTESQELLNCNPVWINDILGFIINILKIIAPVLMVVLSLSITPAIIPHCCSNWNLRSHIGHGVYCLHLTRTNSDHVSPGCLAPSLHWQLSHLRLQALMRLRVSCQVLTRSNDVHGHAVSRYREQKYRGLSALQCELLKKIYIKLGRLTDWH